MFLIVIFRFQYQLWCSTKTNESCFVQNTCVDVHPKVLVIWGKFIASWFAFISNQKKIKMIYSVSTNFINPFSDNMELNSMSSRLIPTERVAADMLEAVQIQWLAYRSVSFNFFSVHWNDWIWDHLQQFRKSLSKWSLTRLFNSVLKAIYLVNSDYSTIKECRSQGRFLLPPGTCSMPTALMIWLKQVNLC